MTESEAKTKWCPMVRVIRVAPADHEDPSYAVNRCKGPACMMWRWELTEHGIREHQAGRLDPSKQNVHGHCGLAGRE